MRLVDYLRETPPSLRAINMEERMPLRDGDATYEAYGESLRETDKAILVKLRGHDDELWLPKSQLAEYPGFGDHGDIVMSEWIAKQKELIGEPKEESFNADDLPF